MSIISSHQSYWSECLECKSFSMLIFQLLMEMFFFSSAMPRIRVKNCNSMMALDKYFAIYSVIQTKGKPEMNI